MQYRQRYTFENIEQDIAPDKRQPNIHKNIVNMDTFLTDRGASLKVSKGTLEIAEFLDNVFVIGHESIADRLFVWVTDNLLEPNAISNDGIYEVSLTFNNASISLIKQGNWGLSTLNPISSVGIRENDISTKLYWIDGYNQARFCNVDNGDLNEDVNFTRILNNSGIVTVSNYGAGAVTSALVRYGFSQYNTAGAESTVTPLSVPLNISPAYGSAKIICTNMDRTVYSNYRIYRLMWEDYEASPTISLIDEGVIPITETVEVIDGGGAFLATIGFETFLDIGSDFIVPRAIESKKQILFLSNYSVNTFDLPDDMRAYFYSDEAYTLGPSEAIPGGEVLLDYVPYESSLYSIEVGLFAELGTPKETMEVKYKWELTGVLKETRAVYRPTYSTQTTAYIDVESGLSSSNNENKVNVTIIKFTGPNIEDYIPYSIGPVLSPQSYIEGILLPEDNLGIELGITNIDTPPGVQASNVVTASFSLIRLTLGELILRYAYLKSPSGYEYVVTEILNNLTYITIKFPDNINTTSAMKPISIVDVGGTTAILTIDATGEYPGIISKTKTYRRIVTDLEIGGTRSPIITGGLKLNTIGAVTEAFANPTEVPRDHDAINPDDTIYKYMGTGSAILGASGTVVEIEIRLSPTHDYYSRFFKAGENYRIGIVWYDIYGRTSPAKWVTDVKIPYVDFTGGSKFHYVLDGRVKYMPADTIAFKFVVVQRTTKDKSIIMQGILQPIMKHIIDPNTEATTNGYYAFPNMKEIKGNGKSNSPTDYFDMREPFKGNVDFPSATDFTTIDYAPLEFNAIYSPEAQLEKHDIAANKIRVTGLCKLDATKDSTRLEFTNPDGNSYTTYAGTTVNKMEFDIKNNIFNPPPDAPVHLFDDFGDNSNSTKDASVHMFSRTAVNFYKSDPVDVDIKFCKFLDSDATLALGTNVISSTMEINQFSGVLNQQMKSNVNIEMVPFYVVETTDNSWIGSPKFNVFLDGIDPSFGSDISDRGFPIVEVILELSSQYKGNSYAAKTSNIYIDASAAITSANVDVTLYGDTYVGMYALPKITSARKLTEPLVAGDYDFVYCLLESSVHMAFANERITGFSGILNESITSELKLIEAKLLLTYKTIFSQIANGVLSIAKPFDTIDIKQYLTRITYTLPKVLGETIDSWTKVTLGSYIDLESQFGDITKLVRLKDTIIAFQETAIAGISILPVAQTVTSSGSVNLGKGSILDNYRYISINTGCNNKQAIGVQGDLVFYIDTVNKTLNILNAGSVSTLKGFNSVTKNHMNQSVSDYIVNDGTGFVVVDEANKQIIFIFSETFPALIYNYAKEKFTHSRTYKANYFLNFGRVVLAEKESKLYALDLGSIGSYFGETKSASIDMVVEPLPGVDKVFDSIVILKQGNLNFDKISIMSSTGRAVNSLPLDFKSKFDLHTAHFPRVNGTRERFRERGLDINLEYNGTEPLNIDEIFIKFTAKKQ